jgi:hypothetical protein
VGVARGALAALGKVGIVLAIAVAFLFGMVGTVYLSLRTAEVKVPDLTGKDHFTAESELQDIGLKIRIRGYRPSTNKQPNTILNQLPEAGSVVKEGIEVAVEVTRAPKEGESVPSSDSEEAAAPEEAKPAENTNTQAANTNQNENQNKPPKNKNTNRNTNKNANNSNNSNNSNNANRNANANNRNPNNRNANNRNANRSANNANRGTTNTTPTPNRNSSSPNANRRAPVVTTPPFNPGANRQRP